MNRIKRLKSKKGSAELLGFAVALPLLFFIFVFFIYMSQIFLAKQSADYAVYAGARAIVVSDYSSLDNPVTVAQINADAIAGESIKYDFSSEIAMVNDNRWVKGNIIEYSIQYNIPTVLGGEKTITSSIAMMIENPADSVSP